MRARWERQPSVEPRWRIELFGGLRAVRGETVVTRFRTQNSALLLAHLALSGAGGPRRQRALLRDELADKLWPENEPRAGRTSLRHALMLLRRVLEPEGVPPTTVLVADRMTVRLNPDAVATDVAEFEAALQAADQAPNKKERTRCLARAVDLYQGELLAGYYEPWVFEEQGWLTERYFGALAQLLALLEQAGELGAALEYARRGVRADPLREEAHRDLMRLLAAVGQPAAALRQYAELARLLARDLADEPSDDVRALAAAIREQTASASTTIGAEPSHPPIPSTPAGNLPLPLDRFFGRRSEMARLIRLLRPPTAESIEDEDLLDDRTPTRLVTLTGPGGSGKTRLALEVARRLRQRWQGAIWFVPLADLTDPRLILDKLLDALRLPRTPQVEPLEQIVAFLSRQPSLLLLDNLEQLLPEGALPLKTLLERVETLTVIVTSRQRLGVRGEQHYPVPPLPLPVITGSDDALPKRAIDHGSLTANASASLFVDRARLVRPDFQVTEGNAAAVAALCRELEGLPLAIELAAGRIGALTPAQMLARLQERIRNGGLEFEAERTGRFDLLVGRSPGTARRHHSLRAALDWSYQLLSPELQRFFSRLSVFRGGWNLDAARMVCEEKQALECLEALQECSLVVTETVGEEMRYRLLETLREFAAEQLSPTERIALAKRHLRHYLALSEHAEAELYGPEQRVWLDRLGREHENLRAALAWSTEPSPERTTTPGAPPAGWEPARSSIAGCPEDIPPGDVEAGLRLGGALWRFWEARGYLTEGHEHLGRLLALAETRNAVRARLLNGAGVLSYRRGDYAAARALYTESLAIQREIGDQGGIAHALFNLGALAGNQGHYETARALLEQSLEIRRELGDKGNIGASLSRLGIVAYDQADYPAARRLHEESLAIQRALVDKRGMANSLNMLGAVAQVQGDHEAARRLFEESLTITMELRDQAGIANSLAGLGLVALRQGDYEAARRLWRESLAIFQQDSAKAALPAVMEGLAELAEVQGQAWQAARLCGAAQALREALGHLLPAGERARYDRLVTVARTALGEKAFAAAWADGRAMSLEQAVRAALAEE